MNTGHKNVKRIHAAAVLSGCVAVAGFGLAAGTAHADDDHCSSATGCYKRTGDALAPRRLGVARFARYGMGPGGLARVPREMPSQSFRRMPRLDCRGNGSRSFARSDRIPPMPPICVDVPVNQIGYTPPDYDPADSTMLTRPNSRPRTPLCPNLFRYLGTPAGVPCRTRQQATKKPHDQAQPTCGNSPPPTRWPSSGLSPATSPRSISRQQQTRPVVRGRSCCTGYADEVVDYSRHAPADLGRLRPRTHIRERNGCRCAPRARHLRPGCR